MQYQKAPVIWITGLSGSGKTTIGTKLYYEIKKEHPQTVFLDGDEVKHIVSGETVGYTEKDRRNRSFKYAHLCHLLSNQGITVVCCVIALFHEVQEWNRKNIEKYWEVFVEADVDTIEKKDSKGLYKKQIEQMVGFGDIAAEFPIKPDVHIYNDMVKSPDVYVDQILCAMKHSNDNELNNYWDMAYLHKKVSNVPSAFAELSLANMQKGKKVLDIGCGNGRDSLYFESCGLIVTAVDTSVEGIRQLREQQGGIFAVCDNFVGAKFLFNVDYDYIYARKSLQEISSEQQRIVIDNVYNALKKDGLFFVEWDCSDGEDAAIQHLYQQKQELVDFQRQLEAHGFQTVLAESDEKEWRLIVKKAVC